MALGAHRYCDLYTWSHAVQEHLVAHTDGALSLVVLWDGLDAEFEDAAGCARLWGVVAQVVALLPPGHWLEFHLWRDHDRTAPHAYLSYYENARRKSAFCAAMRQALAEHLAPRVLTNTVALVLGRLPVLRRGLKRNLRGQLDQAADLETTGLRIAGMLPGGRLATVLEYAALIQRSYDQAPAIARIDPNLSLAEQLIVVPPVLKERLVEIDRQQSQVLYLHLYPDCDAAWILPLVSGSLRLHISQVVLAADTARALRSSERADRLAQGVLSHKGRERQMTVLHDMQRFRESVAQNDLTIHRNAYVIALHDIAGRSQEVERFVNRLQERGARVRDDGFIQLPFLRTLQPGQGYRSPLWRPDHSAQITHMAPVQVFRAGSAHPESLRLGMASQAIAFDYNYQAVAHGFTVAMTGAGKGVDKVATIVETYPFGVDWYVLEMGGSYRWVVEALGGTYTRLDPQAAAVNPLPPRAAAANGLDPLLASGTLSILAFLLTDGRTVLDFHESAAGAAALTGLYSGPIDHDPGLVDLLVSLESLPSSSPEQARAAHAMAANLHSFLETPEGRIFAGQDNVQISPGISGVDLKDVDRASPKLLTFYLVFLCLRFLNLAFANTRQARVLLDEIHRFVAHAPDVLRRLVSEIARMGRKEAAAIDIVTQGLSEIDVLEKEIVNSMPLRSLMYRNDGWIEIADRIGMPARALDIWRKFPFPTRLAWRPAIRSVGHDYYALRLTFPAPLLALADTTPQGLALKDAIAAEESDPLLRLARFLKERPL